MTDEKASISVPLMILTVVAGACILVALGMFLLFFYVSAGGGIGPSPLLALIPLFIGVIAGVGALTALGRGRSG